MPPAVRAVILLLCEFMRVDVINGTCPTKFYDTIPLMLTMTVLICDTDDVYVYRNFTLVVHISGTSGNNRLHDYLHQQLSQLHIMVAEASYRVLLSYHDW